MDKASDFGSEDCRFESCHGRCYFLSFQGPLVSGEKSLLSRRLQRDKLLALGHIGRAEAAVEEAR